MPIQSCPKIIKYKIIAVAISLGSLSLLFAGEPASVTENKGYVLSNPAEEAKKRDGVVHKKESSAAGLVDIAGKEKNLSELQKQARVYRNQGLQMQKLGQLDVALVFYQKALELDPFYTVVYNDLGVVYEAQGNIERAEDSYLQAVKIDPRYLSPYTNLALLCEEKRDMEKAALYWKKRAELGSLDDPLTIKAQQRLNDIAMVRELSSPLSECSREQEIINLTQDILNQKVLERQSDSALAQVNFRKAKLSYAKHDDVKALKEAMDAQLLDSSNEDIGEFIQKVQHRLLSK